MLRSNSKQWRYINLFIKYKAITSSFTACLIDVRAGESINERNFELCFEVCILCLNFGIDIL